VDLSLEQRFAGLIDKEAAALDNNQRLVASNTVQPTGDGGYRVYAILDTAGPETLRTERFQIEVRQVDGKKWQVTDKHLEDSTERLFRETAEAKQFYSFASFEFDREGLKVSATNGSALAYHMQGAIGRIVLAAADLKYEYSPPRDLGTHHTRYAAIRKGSLGEDLVFAPEVAEITCDPASCEELLSGFTGLDETDQGTLSTTLAQHYDRNSKELQNSRTKDPFAGFRLPYPAGSSFFQVAVKKRSEEHWLALEYDSDAGHEVQFHVDGVGVMFGYPAQGNRDGTDPVAIERRDDRDGALYQITELSGEVEVGVLEPEMLQADIVYTLEMKRDLDAIPFSIEAILVGFAAEAKATFNVNELEDGEGRPLSWVRLGESRGVVLLPDTVAAGSEVIIHMEFETKGSVAKFSPSYAYVERSGWLPFVRYTDKIESFELTIKVPPRYKALGVGTCISRKREGRANVSHWVAKNPVHFPTIIFGDYQEDAPKTTAEKSDASAIPVTVHVDKSSMTDWGIRGTQLRPLGEVAVNALNIYRVLFGADYPYGKLDLVNDPLTALGAQAPASIVYLGSAIFRSEATLSTVYARDMTTLVEERIAHEVAHQWWGSLTSCANRRSYWFVESLAEYSAALFMEVVASDGYRNPKKGRAAYLRMVKRWRDETLDSNLLSSVQDSSTLWTNGGDIAAVYSKGPYAFHMLRQTFGDQKFFAFLKDLARELGGKEIVTRDIQAVAERSFGGIGSDGSPYTVDLEWFFDQWIREIGIPQYTFDYAKRQAEDGGYIVEGTVRQRVFAGKHDLELEGIFYRGIVPVTVLGNDKQEYSSRLVVEGPQTPFSLKVPAKPLEVTLNKYGEILSRPVREP
jgi:hypothetical protein